MVNAILPRKAALSVATSQQPEPQRVELDEALRVALVVTPVVLTVTLVAATAMLR